MQHTARARTTDPVTSHEAAADAQPRTDTLRARVYDTLKRAEYGTAHQPFALIDVVTLYQARAARGDVPHASDSGIRTRVSELMRDGLIAHTGQTVTINGRRHRLLELTPTDNTPRLF